MATVQHTVRDDSRYTVIVGWTDELESFFARVYPRDFPRGEPLLELGNTPREVESISELADRIAGYAVLDGPTVTALRHAASPL